MATTIKKILIAQKAPAANIKSPFGEIVKKYGVQIDYHPLQQTVAVTPKEFRSQHIDILSYSAVIFTSKSTIDSFFMNCEAAHITVPNTMKYICSTELIALYLQKYIVYRKRKIFFANGTLQGLVEEVVHHKEEKFLLTLSEPHTPDLSEMLDHLNVNYDSITLAKTETMEISQEEVLSYDMLLLYTPWDIRAVKKAVGDINPLPVIGTFGEKTLKEAHSTGFSVMVNAPSVQAPSMAKAVEIFLSSLKTGKQVKSVEYVDRSEDKAEFLRQQQNAMNRKNHSSSK